MMQKIFKVKEKTSKITGLFFLLSDIQDNIPPVHLYSVCLAK